VTAEKRIIIAGPATQPSWAIAQAKDSTPEPITAVIMCALEVQTVPVFVKLRVSDLKSLITNNQSNCFCLF